MIESDVPTQMGGLLLMTVISPLHQEEAVHTVEMPEYDVLALTRHSVRITDLLIFLYNTILSLVC